MTLRLQWSPEAIRDLTGIHEELASYGVAIAGRFIENLDKELELLQVFPGIGSPRRSSNPRLGSLRVVQVPKFRAYLLFYKTKTDSIRVLRILHSARDVNALLNIE